MLPRMGGQEEGGEVCAPRNCVSDDEVKHGCRTGDDVVRAAQAYEISADDYDGDAGGLRARK
jgi:hypothetical protein